MTANVIPNVIFAVTKEKQNIFLTIMKIWFATIADMNVHHTPPVT